MKKYLINGVLALFAGIYLASCADTETDYVPLAEQKVRAFEEVFKEVYGEIDPHQRWGFTDMMIVANGDSIEPTIIYEEPISTRTFRAGTRAVINVNGNEWRVCPELGETEEDDVTAYVNHTRKWLTENNKKYYEEFPVNITDYYVTQVHCGTDTYENLEHGNIGKGSSHMNHLMIKESSNKTLDDLNGKTWKEGEAQPDFSNTGWFHVNNFNRGDNTDWKGNTLVTQAGTYDFAYHGTEDSKYHNRWIAVKGKDINEAKYGDYWYICFDFEAFINNPTTVFRVSVTNPYRSENYGDNIEIPGAYTSAEQLVGYKYTRKVYNPNTNREEDYTFTLTESNISNVRVVNGNQCVAPNDVYTDWIIRLVPATKKTSDSGSEVNNWTEEDDEWNQVTSNSGRVFCEDLGKAAREDLDYNDVVFDVIIWKHTHIKQPMKSTTTWSSLDNDTVKSTSAATTNGEAEKTEKYYAQIKLLAAGGTIPLTVAGKEVHNAFGVGVTTMVNTRDGNSTAFGSYVDIDTDKNPVYIGDTVITYDTNKDPLVLVKNIEKALDVKIVSSYDNAQVAELTANPGKAPHKLFVPKTTRWASERKPLDLAYPHFGEYVSDATKNWVNLNRNDYYLYSIEHKGLEDMPLVMKTKKVTGAESMDVLTDEVYDYTQQSWTEKKVLLKTDKFWPGDRIRFYGSGINENSYITVSFADRSKPYFVDTKFAESDKNGNYPQDACVEVLLDETYCEKLNNSKEDGKIMIYVQGRAFKLTQITRVPFK